MAKLNLMLVNGKVYKSERKLVILVAEAKSRYMLLIRYTWASGREKLKVKGYRYTRRIWIILKFV